MTIQQIQWALQHDWAIMSCVDADGNIGIDVRNDDPSSPDPLTFFDFQALRAWAGY